MTHLIPCVPIQRGVRPSRTFTRASQALPRNTAVRSRPAPAAARRPQLRPRVRVTSLCCSPVDQVFEVVEDGLGEELRVRDIVGAGYEPGGVDEVCDATGVSGLRIRRADRSGK